MLKFIRYYIEAFGVKSIFFLLRLLSFNRASIIGGYLFQFIGPKLKVTNYAKKNLQNIMLLSSDQASLLVKQVWKNLGNNVGEFVHINRINTNQFMNLIKVKGSENLEFLGKGGFLFTGHIGNWEILPRFISQNNLQMALVYRAANNKIVDQMIVNERTKYSDNIPKGQNGIKLILNYLKDNKVVGMLVDQKMNDGIEVPFFGKPAMTAPAIAKLALKFNLPIVPIRVIRTRNQTFIIEISKPLDTSSNDPYKIMLNINHIIENWIREYPEQWFWLHRRWKIIN